MPRNTRSAAPERVRRATRVASTTTTSTGRQISQTIMGHAPRTVGMDQGRNARPSETNTRENNS